jgi:hypothetical protein
MHVVDHTCCWCAQAAALLERFVAMGEVFCSGNSVSLGHVRDALGLQLAGAFENMHHTNMEVGVACTTVGVAFTTAGVACATAQV